MPADRSREFLKKAVAKLGALRPLTKSSALFSPADMGDLISTIDEESVLASRDDATSLVALLLTSHKLSKVEIGDDKWKLLQLSLFEVFSRFPAFCGYEAVRSRPSAGLPKTFQIARDCSESLRCLQTAREMALRHIAEHERRAAEKKHPPLTDEAVARMNQKWQSAKADILGRVARDLPSTVFPKPAPSSPTTSTPPSGSDPLDPETQL